MKGMLRVGINYYMSFEEIKELLIKQFPKGFLSRNATDFIQSYIFNMRIKTYHHEWSYIWKRMVDVGLLNREVINDNKNIYFYNYVKQDVSKNDN